jgi:hypothetical protein
VALAATVTARHTPEENALLRSLAGMANNLNQLTKLSHQTGFYRTRLLIDGLLGKLKRIMVYLLGMLSDSPFKF